MSLGSSGVGLSATSKNFQLSSAKWKVIEIFGIPVPKWLSFDNNLFLFKKNKLGEEEK